MTQIKFKLSEGFISKYKHKKPPFGFNGFGELVYLRTYSRQKENGTNEKWWETIRRVVEGTYNMQKNWIEEHNLGWNAHRAQNSAQEMYDRMFNMKFLPPGRGLWAMGSPITEEKNLYAALNNCAFVSTKNLNEDYSKPFCFLMDASMLGVGVGFSVEGAGKIIIKGPNKNRKSEIYEIPDSREGWVESVKLLLESYFFGTNFIDFDYTKIREAGLPIKGFGGKTSGPDPLKQCHEMIRVVLDKEISQPISSKSIVDIMNLIGRCVVSGNVRRSAEIVFGSYNDSDYLDLKNPEVFPERNDPETGWGWSSNNSIFCDVGMDYKNAAQRTMINGEPGYAWLDNMKMYSRMNNGPDGKDHRVAGGNPCLEQSLESYELCCLVETFPNNHESKEDFLRTLKFAYLYAKTVTLGKTHWPETNRVMLRNRRIGCSMSGLAQFLTKKGLHELKLWCESGYKELEKWDEIYSDWFAIPKSIKKTSIKPSGTISLLAGATPGMHYPESRFYIRRMRLAKNSELIDPLEEAGYKVEPATNDKNNTSVVEFPIDVGEGIRTVSEVSLWEQMSLAAFLQKYWADNQVSCTVTFDPKTEGHEIENVLNYFQYQLKGISFLPKLDYGAYPQMPYEEITEEQYKKSSKNTKPIKFGHIKEEAEAELYCTTDKCELKTAVLNA